MEWATLPIRDFLNPLDNQHQVWRVFHKLFLYRFIAKSYCTETRGIYQVNSSLNEMVCSREACRLILNLQLKKNLPQSDKSPQHTVNLFKSIFCISGVVWLIGRSLSESVFQRAWCHLPDSPGRRCVFSHLARWISQWVVKPNCVALLIKQYLLMQKRFYLEWRKQIVSKERCLKILSLGFVLLLSNLVFFIKSSHNSPVTIQQLLVATS